MAEDLIDYELDGEAPDDIEPIQGEPELYEHFRTVVDKGQAPVRIDKYLFERDGSRQRLCHGQWETGEKQLQGQAAGRADRYDGPPAL